MTESEFKRVFDLLERIEHNIEAQNGRVRKNTEEIAEVRQWKNSEWEHYRQDAQKDREELKTLINQIESRFNTKVDEITDELKELKTALGRVEIQQATDKTVIDQVREWGIPLLMLAAWVAHVLGIRFP